VRPNWDPKPPKAYGETTVSGRRPLRGDLSLNDRLDALTVDSAQFRGRERLRVNSPSGTRTETRFVFPIVTTDLSKLFLNSFVQPRNCEMSGAIPGENRKRPLASKNIGGWQNYQHDKSPRWTKNKKPSYRRHQLRHWDLNSVCRLFGVPDQSPANRQRSDHRFQWPVFGKPEFTRSINGLSPLEGFGSAHQLLNRRGFIWPGALSDTGRWFVLFLAYALAFLLRISSNGKSAAEAQSGATRAF